jgi:hypothetical protein
MHCKHPNLEGGKGGKDGGWRFVRFYTKPGTTSRVQAIEVEIKHMGEICRCESNDS